MLFLLFFVFISGLVTIAAPCIWPLLPIILSSTTTGGKRKPLGITLGIVTSFALFTLTLSYIVRIIPLDPDTLRLLAVVVIGLLGLTLAIPKLSQLLEGYISRLSGLLGSTPRQQKQGFIAGYVTGFSLGIVWSPCAGPILATIATLAATRQVTAQVILVTTVYVIGAGIPLFIFATAGTYVFTKSRLLSRYTGRIQQVFGVVMILTAAAIYTGYDKTIQVKLLDAFPSYSTYLYKLESRPEVQKELSRLQGTKDNAAPAVVPQMMLPNLGTAAEFAGISQWFNTPRPLTMSQLRGTVVLIDYWTYTCINCLRTLPYIKSWYAKYRDRGFIVVGVHTPEFEFEKKPENVLRAIKEHEIRYPVALDNDYRTWRAYDNHYWPAHYLIDADGTIRKVHFGEGGYDEMEMAIKSLLKESGQTVTPEVAQLEDTTPQGYQTPETYLGMSRMERYAGSEEIRGGVQTFSLPRAIPQDQFALGGTWDVRGEYCQSQKGSALALNFFAGKVYLVITPATDADSVTVFLDGKPAAAGVAGSDVRDGAVVFDKNNPHRLYNLIDLRGKKENHLLRLEFNTPGTAVYAFTFG